MRRALPSFVLSVFAALLLAPLGAAQDEDDQADDALAFYLHAVGTDCADGAFETFMDTVDSEGDLDGCGLIGGGFVDATFEGSYPSKEALGLDVLADSTATFHIFLTTQNPGEVTVTANFAAGKKSCSGTSDTVSVTNTPVVNDWTEFVIECAFEGKDDANGTATKKPTLSLTVGSDVSIHYGYEGDHASRVDLYGLGQSMPPVQTQVDEDTGGESPGVGALALMAAVGAAALVLTRRQG